MLRERGGSYRAAPGTLTCIDLFCGCGGFSLGMQRAGFDLLAAIDSSPVATAAFDQNFPGVPFVLTEDLTTFSPDALAGLLGRDTVDVIVGGPPCQGFSIARQVERTNHGQRLKHDPCRHLYQDFLRYVDFFQPRLFVMENVLGLRNPLGTGPAGLCTAQRG
jgi:DNA (cytosine-5)-methyltransferase 1